MIRVFAVLLILTSSVFCGLDNVKKDLRALMRGRYVDYSKIQKKIEEFSEYDGKDAAEYLVSFIDSKRTPEIFKMTASRILSDYKSKEVREFLAREVKDFQSDVRILRAFVQNSDEICRKICSEIVLKSNEPQKVAVALGGLGHFKNHSLNVIKKMITLLDKSNSISERRGACVALASINNPEIAVALFHQLKDKALGSFAIDALQRLTGQDFGNDPPAWRKWLLANKNFKPVNTSMADYLEEKRKKEEEKRAEMEKLDSAEFYGVEIEGKNVLFILDKSGSMAEQTDYGTRLDRLKKEFIDMLEVLDSDTSLGVQWFPENKTYPIRGGISSLTGSFKGKLVKHVKRIKALGGTPIAEAMTYAFEKIVQKRDIDTIYLLSDGAPNTPAEQVRKLIKNLNAGYYVKIHTISIGDDSQFMKDVASDNFGSYTAIE